MLESYLPNTRRRPASYRPCVSLSPPAQPVPGLMVTKELIKLVNYGRVISM